MSRLLLAVMLLALSGRAESQAAGSLAPAKRAFWVKVSSQGLFTVYFAPSLTGKTSQGDMTAAVRLVRSRPLSDPFPAIEEQAHLSIACSTGRYTIHDHTTRSSTMEIRDLAPLVEDAQFSEQSQDWIQRVAAALCRAPVRR